MVAVRRLNGASMMIQCLRVLELCVLTVRQCFPFREIATDPHREHPVTISARRRRCAPVSRSWAPAVLARVRVPAYAADEVVRVQCLLASCIDRSSSGITVQRSADQPEVFPAASRARTLKQ